MPCDHTRRAEDNEVVLRIKRAEGIKGSIYCRAVLLHNKQTFTTNVTKDGIWDQSFSFNFDDKEKISLEVYEQKWFGRESVVGSSLLPLSFLHYTTNSLMQCKLSESARLCVQVSINDSSDCRLCDEQSIQSVDSLDLIQFCKMKLDLLKELSDNMDILVDDKADGGDGAELDVKSVVKDLESTLHKCTTTSPRSTSFKQKLDSMQPAKAKGYDKEANFWNLLYNLPQSIDSKRLEGGTNPLLLTDADSPQPSMPELEEQLRLLQKELEMERYQVQALKKRNTELEVEVQRKTTELVDLKEKDAARDKIVMERLVSFDDKLRKIDAERELLHDCERKILARERELVKREVELTRAIEDLKSRSTTPSPQQVLDQNWHPKSNEPFAQQLATISSRLSKLDQLDDVMHQLHAISSSGGVSAERKSRRSAADIKVEMEKLQQIIMDDKADAKEREAANVKIDRLFVELASTDEYKQEIKRAQEERARINEPLNQEALKVMLQKYQESGDTEEVQNRKRLHHALTLIGMDRDQILGKHQSDFNQYLLGDLSITELRAIRASLPHFRRDQKRQQEFLEAVELKIEQLTKNPVKIPEKAQKISTPKPLRGVLVSSKSNVPMGMANLAAELIAKRRMQQEGEP